jgi:putative solute:sodium symporter small subunit
MPRGPVNAAPPPRSCATSAKPVQIRGNFTETLHKLYAIRKQARYTRRNHRSQSTFLRCGFASRANRRVCAACGGALTPSPRPWGCATHIGDARAASRHQGKEGRPLARDRRAIPRLPDRGSKTRKEARMSTQGQGTRQQQLDAYWKANLRLIVTLLLIWFAVAYIPPLFVNQLNAIVIAGFPLGYYMASQGSLIVFVVLIFYYAFRMNRLDEQYGLKDRDK